jgi:hypothetical protein
MIFISAAYIFIFLIHQLLSYLTEKRKQTLWSLFFSSSTASAAAVKLQKCRTEKKDEREQYTEGM